MRQLTIRPMLTLAAVPITAVALTAVGTGCGGGDNNNDNTSTAAKKSQATTPATTEAPSPAASTLQVKGVEFAFTLSAQSVAKPGKVTFDFKNAGHVAHDFRINGKQTPLTQPGGTANLTVTFKKKGTYSYLCTVPGHAEAGMKGVFTVR